MLSIRTQDRMALVPYNGIIKITEYVNCWGISIIQEEFKELGTYETKKRALEVLDEIQEKISDKWNELLNSNLFDLSYITNPFDGNKVYQMPKE